MALETLKVWALLALAALLEAGGDAAIRSGLRGQRGYLFLGPALLVVYGFMVNATRWDFGRLIGVYIAFFFLVSQAISVLVFRERIHPPTLAGGALIVAGGLVLTFWKTPSQ